MMKKIVTLAGDDISLEIVAAGLEVLEVVTSKINFDYGINAESFGGVGIDTNGRPLSEETLDTAESANVILLAAIGGPKYDNAPTRLEQGLLAIRKELDLFVSIKPIHIFDALKHLSPLKSEHIEGVGSIAVRELTGGIYFDERQLQDESTRNTSDYSAQEIRRIIREAFELVRLRGEKVTSVDRQNVLATSELWRKVAEEVTLDFPDVTLKHQLADSAVMIMVTDPSRSNVVIMENLFGGILSDESSVLSDTLGVMPSASHSESGPSLYEPTHGSAPNIIGRGITNPASMILSVVTMLRESFGEVAGAEFIEDAVDKTFNQGILTCDLGGRASTTETTAAIIVNL